MISWLIGLMIVLLPAVLALPWLASIDPDFARAQARRPVVWAWTIACLAGGGFLVRLVLAMNQDRDRLEIAGRVYGGVLHLLLVASLFVLAFVVMGLVWPKGSAVALAAFRESIRQPLFWLVIIGTTFLILVSLFIPYFTFGDDYKMMKSLGYDIVMLGTALFAVITASMSITEEIEGRTAITLMSKPLSRRQFLLGKFTGILLASLAMTILLGWVLNWALFAKPWLDPFDDVTDPLQMQIMPQMVQAVQSVLPEGNESNLLAGAASWFGSTVALTFGLVIGFCQVMIFLAIAAALATRLPLAVNMISCLVFFYLGNLAPYLVQLARNLQHQYAAEHGGAQSATYDLVQFVARVFDTVLPALEYFSLGPAVIRDQPLDARPYALYVASVVGYSVLYTAIALLFGLILFEDRDLA